MQKIELLLEGLTEQQQNAVSAASEDWLKVSAGAGSGKTEVLTRRIAALLLNGIKPAQLTAITYTQKAAAEMKNRLIERKRVNPAELRELEVSTFHAFLSSILKQNPFLAGIDRTDKVLSENDRKILMAELLEEFAQLYGDRIISGEQALGAEVAQKIINQFPQTLGKIRRYMLEPSSFYRLAKDRFKKRSEDVSALELNTLEWLFKFYSCYIQQLNYRGLLDFDEILIKGSKLVAELKEQNAMPLRSVFLIDEFQDNNTDQINIIRRFCEGRKSHITVVGDDKQSIYSFQGADVEAFRSFESDKTINLNDNFRSYSQIIKLAEAFVLDDKSGLDVQPQIARRGDSVRKPAVTCMLSEPEIDVRQQSEHLADLIEQMVSKKMALSDDSGAIKYGDIAIITSSIRKIPAELEDALAARQIPYVMSGGLGFYARSEIEEILSFLRLLVYPDDDHAAVKILTGPLYGLDDSELAQLTLSKRREEMSLVSYIMAADENSIPLKVRLFRKLFVKLRSKSLNSQVLELCHIILEQAGFYEYAATCPGFIKSKRMLNNISKFLAIVRNFQQNGIFTSLRDFIVHIERFLLSDVDEDEAGLGLEEGEAVKILTIHKSKGLEFPVVFCPFLKKRPYRINSRIHFDKQTGLMVSDPSLSARKGMSCEHLDYIERDQLLSECEDVRKLYVAFTRARDLLIITGEKVLTDETEDKNLSEPLCRVKEILEQNPDIGKVTDLSLWPEILSQWLEYGVAQDSQQNEEDQSETVSVEQLSDFLESISDFHTEATETKETALKGQNTFSLDELNLYNLCPGRYFFSNSHIKPFTEKQISSSALCGTLIHESIRVFHLKQGSFLTSEKDRVTLALNVLELMKPYYDEISDKDYQRGRAVLINYACSEFAQAEPWLVEAEVNVKFEAAFGSFFVRGFVDRVDRHEDGVKIYDFKTMKHSERVHNSFLQQMALYRIASDRGVLGDSGCLNFPELKIVYLTPESIKTVPIEPDVVGLENFVVSTVESMKQNPDFKRIFSDKCKNCGYAIFCRPLNKRKEDDQ